jgi:hypothetical protein
MSGPNHHRVQSPPRAAVGQTRGRVLRAAVAALASFQEPPGIDDVPCQQDIVMRLPRGLIRFLVDAFALEETGERRR